MRHAVMIPQCSDTADRRPVILSPRRRSVAEQKGPLIACPGCGRPTKGAACRGCDPKKGRA